MKEYITEAQKREIEELAKDGHADAIMAAMSDMYHEGWVDAGKFAKIICGWLVGSLGVGCAVYLSYRIVKHTEENQNKNSQKES